MHKIYGEEKSARDTIRFLENYVERIKNDGRKHRSFFAKNWIKKLAPTKVLDYGCGWGIGFPFWDDSQKELYGYEPDINSLEICKVFLDHCNLEVKLYGNSEEISADFDMVVSLQVLEHVINIGDYFSGIRSALRDDGHLILSTPNIINPVSIASGFKSGDVAKWQEKTFSNYQNVHTHINTWDLFHLSNLLAAHGFEIELFEFCEGMRIPGINRKLYWNFWPFYNFQSNLIILAKKISSSVLHA
jgi:2-polyprenyl-3-methyl-5-hydroxy-6-metoxy-1,4-benzoquinol methylase